MSQQLITELMNSLQLSDDNYAPTEQCSSLLALYSGGV
jgi:hypothetical protein